MNMCLNIFCIATCAFVSRSSYGYSSCLESLCGDFLHIAVLFIGAIRRSRDYRYYTRILITLTIKISVTMFVLRALVMPHPTGPDSTFRSDCRNPLQTELITSVVLRMISDDFSCFLMFSAVFRCFPTVF